MAEGFAKTYGKDVMIAASAGLSPAVSMPPLTIKVMNEKGISVEDHFPKEVGLMRGTTFDLIVNMSGQKLPANMTVPVEEWLVKDPIGKSEETYRATRDDIEGRVMRLVLTMRGGQRAKI